MSNKGLALAVVLSAWLPAAQAATFQVDTVSDETDALPGDGLCATGGGFCSLRAAVQEANASAGDDTVQLPAGSYILSLGSADEDAAGEGDLDILESLTIVGAGSAETVIDGNLSDRLFQVPTGVGLVLQGVVLQRGQVLDDGGAILAQGSLELTDVVVSAGTAAGQGGGLFASGTLQLTQCVLEDNTALQGGGLYLAGGGTATLDGSTLTANKADEGAGIYALGTLSVRTSILSANQADLQGGGVYLAADGTFENSTLSNNRALEAGAGMYAQEGTLSVYRSRFDANRLSGNYGMGAGLYAGTQSQVTLSESELTGNGIDKPTTSGSTHGGGLYFAGLTLSAENTTISTNEADVGGGLEVAGGSAQLSYSTLAANRATSGANLTVSGGASASLGATLLGEPQLGVNCSGSVTSQGYNLASDESCGLSGTGDRQSAEAGLGLLDSDSGTHALVAGSEAMDAGDPEQCPLYDGAGWVRSDARCDIGARESGAEAAQGGTITFELTESQAGEAAGSITLNVIREGGNIPVSADYATQPGSAASGVDYLPVQGTLLWGAAENGVKTITLSIVDDSDYESLETLQVVLSAAHGGAVLGTVATHTLSIIDDDPEPVVEPPPEEEPPPTEEPPAEEEQCLPSKAQCVPPGIEKKGGGALNPLWLLGLMLVRLMRRRAI